MLSDSMARPEWLWLISTQRCENHVSSRFLLVKVRALCPREVMLISLNRGVSFRSYVLMRKRRLLWQLCSCDSPTSARDGAEAEAAALRLRILSSTILLSVNAVSRDCGLARVRWLHSGLLKIAAMARVAVHWVSKRSHASAATNLLLLAIILTLRVGHLLLQELLIVILLVLLGIIRVLFLVAMWPGSLLWWAASRIV